MKSFDEIVDGLWKPVKTKKDIYDTPTWKEYYSVVKGDVKICSPSKVINLKAFYAKELMQPFYGRGVQEPVVKICKRILEKPNRFHLVKELERYTRTISLCSPTTNVYKGWGVIEDKDTKQKFARKNIDFEISNLSCLTYHEQVLLTAVLDEWYNHQKEILAKKKAAREEKRKERFRKELSDLYEGY
ncbi:hypothetical protein ACOKQT_17950 [Vibrio cholerae]|uniref:hypothetical protein n=1 Tax=Vibrio cholerae TaxID=666 RepID=UPI002047CB87|nr:hypothetical protein 1992IndM4_0805 [Vibrio phage ICP1]